jgi:hypothetical protein
MRRTSCGCPSLSVLSLRTRAKGYDMPRARVRDLILVAYHASASAQLLDIAEPECSQVCARHGTHMLRWFSARVQPASESVHSRVFQSDSHSMPHGLEGRFKMKAAMASMVMLAVLTAAAPAIAFDQMAAQQACGKDVDALCSEAVPDQKLIAACMQRHIKQVSAACRQFMAASDAEMRREKRNPRAAITPSDPH